MSKKSFKAYHSMKENIFKIISFGFGTTETTVKLKEAVEVTSVDVEVKPTPVKRTPVETPVSTRKTFKKYNMKKEGFLFSFAFEELAESIFPAQFHAVYDLDEDVTSADILYIFPNAKNIIVNGDIITFTVDGLEITLDLEDDTVIRTSSGKKIRLRRNSDGSYEFDYDDTCFLFYILEDDDEEYYESDIQFSRGDLKFTADEVDSVEDINEIIAEMEADLEKYEDDVEVEDEIEDEDDNSDVYEETVETTDSYSHEEFYDEPSVDNNDSFESSVDTDTTDSFVDSDTSD